MPKIRHVVFLNSYDIDGCLLCSHPFYYTCYDDVLSYYVGICDMLLRGLFLNVRRIDLVSGGRVLFTFSDVRKVVNQINYSIPLTS